jgi:hypothetical protein
VNDRPDCIERVEPAEASGSCSPDRRAPIFERSEQRRDRVRRCHVSERERGRRSFPVAPVVENRDFAVQTTLRLEELRYAGCFRAAQSLGIAREQRREDRQLTSVERPKVFPLLCEQSKCDRRELRLQGLGSPFLARDRKPSQSKRRHGDRSGDREPDCEPRQGGDHRYRRPRIACTRARSSCGLKGFLR